MDRGVVMMASFPESLKEKLNISLFIIGSINGDGVILDMEL